MDEKELASQLQGTKDDADEWGDATPDPDTTDPAVASRAESAPKRRLAAMVSVRLSPEELEAVQARAAERGESVSGYLRGIALRDVTVVTTVFRLPVVVSSSERYMSEIASSPIVKDGGRLLTRAT
jgi:predicted DNA binding CopG/RHH family protein